MTHDDQHLHVVPPHLCPLPTPAQLGNPTGTRIWLCPVCLDRWSITFVGESQGDDGYRWRRESYPANGAPQVAGQDWWPGDRESLVPPAMQFPREPAPGTAMGITSGTKRTCCGTDAYQAHKPRCPARLLDVAQYLPVPSNRRSKSLAASTAPPPGGRGGQKFAGVASPDQTGSGFHPPQEVNEKNRPWAALCLVLAVLGVIVAGLGIKWRHAAGVR